MQNDIIRAEQSHAISGVSGRLFTLCRPPAPWKPGVFANQSWISESRPVKGYGTNGQMHVNIKFDDECRNGHNTFSITADIYTTESRRHRDIAAGGCLHDEISRVFPELAHLIKWHLVSTDGPMHYIANTCYHAMENGATHAWVYFTGTIDPLKIGAEKERLIGYETSEVARGAENTPGYRVVWDEKTAKVRNIEFAKKSACWLDAPDSVLMLDKPELSKILAERLPGLLSEFRADIERAGFLWECPTAE